MPHHEHSSPVVTVLTGAGVSTGSGIPDFRGPQGTWTLHPEQAALLEIRPFLADADVRRRGWAAWAASPVWGAQPTDAHRALVELERAGALGAVLTQNFDGLHQRAGSSPEHVVELHGTATTTSCVRCGARQPTSDVLATLADDPDPHCACGGVLKPDVVYFGEMLDERAIERSVAAVTDADVLLAVGTTLTVQPVASLAAVAVEAGTRLVIVNAEPTPYDRLADEIVREPIEQSLPALVTRLLAEQP